MVNATCKADPEDFAALSDELSSVVNVTAINTVVSVLMGMYIVVCIVYVGCVCMCTCSYIHINTTHKQSVCKLHESYSSCSATDG